MYDHVLRCFPEEACGLIAGSGISVSQILPILNAAHSQTHFEMDPKEQLAAFRWINDQQLSVLGIYHSHPEGPAYPSQSDVAAFSYPEALYAIWSIENRVWQIQGYRISAMSVVEVLLQFNENSTG